jgi:hypothetical protein
VGGRLPCGFRFSGVLCADSACSRYFRLKKRREQNAFAVEGRSGIGGTAKATAALGELTHAALMLWLITQLQECGNQFLSLEPNIKILSCFGTGNAIPALQFTFCQDTERDRVLGRFAA